MINQSSYKNNFVNTIRCAPNLTPKENLVARALADCVDIRTGRCVVPLETVARDTNCGLMTVRRALNGLEKKKLVEVIRSPQGSRIPNSYSLLAADDIDWSFWRGDKVGDHVSERTVKDIPHVSGWYVKDDDHVTERAVKDIPHVSDWYVKDAENDSSRTKVVCEEHSSRTNMVRINCSPTASYSKSNREDPNSANRNYIEGVKASVCEDESLKVVEGSSEPVSKPSTTTISNSNLSTTNTATPSTTNLSPTHHNHNLNNEDPIRSKRSDVIDMFGKVGKKVAEDESKSSNGALSSDLSISEHTVDDKLTSPPHHNHNLNNEDPMREKPINKLKVHYEEPNYDDEEDEMRKFFDDAYTPSFYSEGVSSTSPSPTSFSSEGALTPTSGEDVWALIKSKREARF